MSTNLAKFPLSPEFLRNQLHNEMWAQMAEARIHNCQQLQQGQAAAAAPGQRPKKVGKRAAESFEVEEIITEKRSKFLVRWAGYVTHPLALPRARPNPRPPAPPHARRNYTDPLEEMLEVHSSTPTKPDYDWREGTRRQMKLRGVRFGAWHCTQTHSRILRR